MPLTALPAQAQWRSVHPETPVTVYDFSNLKRRNSISCQIGFCQSSQPRTIAHLPPFRTLKSSSIPSASCLRRARSVSPSNAAGCSLNAAEVCQHHRDQPWNRTLHTTSSNFKCQSGRRLCSSNPLVYPPHEGWPSGPKQSMGASTSHRLPFFWPPSLSLSHSFSLQTCFSFIGMMFITFQIMMIKGNQFTSSLSAQQLRVSSRRALLAPAKKLAEQMLTHSNPYAQDATHAAAKWPRQRALAKVIGQRCPDSQQSCDYPIFPKRKVWEIQPWPLPQERRHWRSRLTYSCLVTVSLFFHLRCSTARPISSLFSARSHRPNFLFKARWRSSFADPFSRIVSRTQTRSATARFRFPNSCAWPMTSNNAVVPQ